MAKMLPWYWKPKRRRNENANTVMMGTKCDALSFLNQTFFLFSLCSLSCSFNVFLCYRSFNYCDIFSLTPALIVLISYFHEISVGSRAWLTMRKCFVIYIFLASKIKTEKDKSPSPKTKKAQG